MFYKNLEAEQARNGLSNRAVAEHLGILENTYGNKKRKGTFKLSEGLKLAAVFNCSVEYLFAIDSQQTTA